MKLFPGRSPERYLVWMLLAICVVSAACNSLNPSPTPTSIPLLTASDALQSFARAGIAVGGIEQGRTIERDAPRDFIDRILFEIPRIAPAGGQIVVFGTDAERVEWEAYIERLRSDSETRRDVIYTYFHKNIMLQLNASLTNSEAAAFRTALEGL